MTAPAEQADDEVVGGAADDGTGEGAGQQHPLDGDVDDAGALAQHAGQRAEGQGGRPLDRAR